MREAVFTVASLLLQSETLEVPDQVQRLILKATSVENLCQGLGPLQGDESLRWEQPCVPVHSRTNIACGSRTAKCSGLLLRALE
jgi:hypothetical protein